MGTVITRDSCSMVRKKLIIDTDTGIDDAMAILMALEAHKRGEIEVLAISAVVGNCSSADAERNILRTLDAAQCPEIPVYSRAACALVVPYENTEHYHGQDGFNDVVFEDAPDLGRVVQGETAAHMICRLSQENPGEICLVAIGPLTNVATAMLNDPPLSGRLSELVIMGGNFEAIGNVSEAAEFNFHADPEAAFLVLNRSLCPTIISTWELSYKYTKVDLGWRKKALGTINTKAANLINRLEEVWFSGDWLWEDNWILCDQLAICAAIYPQSVLESSQQIASVELQGQYTRGMMVLDQREYVMRSGARKNIRLIKKLDTEILMQSLHRAFSISTSK